MTDPNDKSGTIGIAPPFEFPLSEKVRGVYGFKDGRVELEAQLPKAFHLVKKVFKETFTLEQLLKLKEGVDKAVLFGQMPAEERARIGAE
jgi:hypothetical protein